MNKFYRSIWNESLGAWVATQEGVAAKGKKSRSGRHVAIGLSLSVAGLLAASNVAAQTAVSGNANNAGSGQQATVDQNCNQAYANRQNPGNNNNQSTMMSNACATAVGNKSNAQQGGVALTS